MKYPSFSEAYPLIRDEFAEANWDPATGKDPAVMREELTRHFEENKHRPYPVVFAEAFAYVLENGRLDLNPNTPFPDKICHGVSYTDPLLPHVPIAAGPGVLEHFAVRNYNEVMDAAIPGVRKMRELATVTGLAIPDLDVWHAVYDWNALVELGFPGILDRLLKARNAKAQAGTLTKEQEIFYESAEIEARAVLTYVRRMAEEATAKGMEELAQALSTLLVSPPTNFYEVLLFQHIAMTVGELPRERIRSYGAVDQLWAPFYQADLASGRYSKEEIREMLRFFLVKISAEKRYANHPICISTDWDEDSIHCELMLLFLDVYQKLKVQNPKLHIRCSARMPEVILRKFMEMTRAGASSLILYNDEVIYAGYEKIGISREVAKDYLPIGCNETCIPGLEEMHICSAWINLVKGVEYALTGGEDLLRQIHMFGYTPIPETWEEFLETFYLYLHRFAVFTMENVNQQAPYAYATNPSPYVSATMESCVERGKDVFDCGLPLANESIKIFALATCVDALLAVKKYVYEEKRLTPQEFTEILRNDWRGHEKLRLEILADQPKWGNGEEEPDRLGADIYAFMAREMVGKPTTNGGVYRLGGDSVNFSEVYGAQTSATPDGRRAGDPLSKNIRPVNGCEYNGLSGLLKSFAAIDFTDAVDGAPCDFYLHPSAVEGEEGLDFMCAIVHLFFENGGCNIQGNVLDYETLLKARENPHLYPDLQVRVSGWNEYFVNMTPAVQEDILKRASGGTYGG